MNSNKMSKIQIAKAKRLRSTPYTSRIEKQGLKAYTTYNHMLLPAGFEDSLEDSYYHLKENVQVWDVAGERQVEILGKDSAKLVQLMTCRDLSKSKVGRCYYCPIIDDKAGLINDPVVLKLDDPRYNEKRRLLVSTRINHLRAKLLKNPTFCTITSFKVFLCALNTFVPLKLGKKLVLQNNILFLSNFVL